MERTLSIIKPDGVAKGLIGEVLKRFESNGIKIAAMKMIHMNKKQAEGFYDVHQGKPFFSSLTDFMSSGPCVVLILEGEAERQGGIFLKLEFVQKYGLLSFPADQQRLGRFARRRPTLDKGIEVDIRIDAQGENSQGLVVVLFVQNRDQDSQIYALVIVVPIEILKRYLA